MHAMTLVTMAALIQFVYFSIQVGKVREKTGIAAPAMSGNDEFERANRVQQNTMEQLVVFIPSMWICGQYFNPLWAAGVGAVFVIGRFMYRAGYMRDAKSRASGFVTGFFASAILILGSVVGAVMGLL